MKKPTRIKAPQMVREDFDFAIAEVARLTVELRALTAERDAEIQQAQETNQRAIKEVSDEIGHYAGRAEKYADAHRAELLPDETKAKSAETPLAVFGYRTGMPQLKTLPKWTWDQVTAELEKYHFRKWLRVKKEPAKDLMLAAYQKRPGRIGEVLKNLGVRVAQVESFYIEPKVAGAKQVKGGAS